MKSAAFGAFMTALMLVIVSVAQKPAANQLIRIGGIAAENGEFAFSNNRITAYSHRDICVTNGASDKCSLLTATGEPVSYEVNAQSMRKVTHNVPIAVAHEFQLCDSFDQVSRPINTAFRSALPKEAKVKTIEDYDHDRTLVVYSVPGKDHYLIKVSLLAGTLDKGYSLVGTVPVSEHGDYCGMQAIARGLRALLVDEPSGSSDYSVAYLFAVRP